MTAAGPGAEPRSERHSNRRSDRRSDRPRWRGPAAGALGFAVTLAAAFWWAWGAGAQGETPAEYAREPPDQIVTAVACGECHLAEIEVWKKTEHATGFRTLHRKEAAEAIAEKMGFRLIKRDSLCLRCHYTPTEESGELRAVSGVSCESCHGAGRDWINVHNSYGKGFDYSTEPAEHRRERIEASRKAGMRQPSDLYGVATSCFGCHTVPEEKLVNVGGHSTGSVDFELVARSQGPIRHNFLTAVRGGADPTNRERTLPEKRPLYVTGRTVALEYSLRGVAEATENGGYSRAMSRRYQVALREVQKIGRVAEVPEVSEILAIASQVRAVPNNRAALLAAADLIGAATRHFLDRQTHDSSAGEQLASLDDLVLGRALPELEPEPAAVLADAGGSATSGTGSGAADGAQPGSAAGGETASATGATASTTVRAGVPAEGEVKRHIRPRSQHRTLDGGACSNCHEGPNAWWVADRHYAAAQPFLAGARKNVEIALRYGIRPQDVAKGNRVCMDCHGTVPTGSEGYEVFDGVSCQGCHGAAADFLEPHKEGDKALGVRRPGYLNALRLGMSELQSLTTRATTCTGCHYVTDRRLLSAGHPSGKDFDYVAGMAKIKHWQHTPAPAAQLTAAFQGVLASRGPVPSVRLAELAQQEVAVVAQTRERSPSLRAASGASWNQPRPAGQGGRAGTVESRISRPPTPVTPRGGITLPPFPDIDAATPIEDVLLQLKQRLELLYAVLQRAAVQNPPVQNRPGGSQ